MRRHLCALFASMLVVGLVAACGENPAGPAGPEPLQQDLEGQIATDPALAETTLGEVQFSTESVPEDLRAKLEECRERFARAREAYEAGRREEAHELARQGRRCVAEAILMARGEEGIAHLFARVEQLLDRLVDAADEFDRAGELAARIRTILAEARAAYDEGDLVTAGERLLFALQVADHFRLRHPDNDRGPRAARFQLARAVAALSLAERCIGDGATESQLRLLRATGRYIRAAREAAEAGAYPRAIHLAARAELLALVAVLDGEPDEGEVRQIVAKARELIAAAEGRDLTEEQERLLGLAVRLFERGVAAIEEGNVRGVALVWKAGVTARLLFD